MTLKDSLLEYKSLLAAKLRLHDTLQAGDDADKLHDLSKQTDDDILWKYSWVLCLTAAPVCFLVVPFIIGLLQGFLPPLISAILWTIAKLAMAAVFLLFLATAFYTFRKSRD